MNAEIKAKWLEALLSGNYRQGRIFLKRFTGVTKHCCLGVLAEVMREPFELSEDSFETNKIYLLYRSSSILVPGVREKCGLDSVAQSKLTDLNDTERRSFTEIADWIEVNL